MPRPPAKATARPRSAPGKAKRPGLAPLVQAFFDKVGWDARWPEAGVFALANVDGEHGRWEVVVNVREDARQVLVMSLCPLLVPPARIAAVGEFASRATTGLALGNFELDWDDGELRYKTSIDAGDGELTVALLEPLFAANVTMMDHYLPGVRAVLGGADPAEAVADCELGGLFDEPE